MQCLGITVLSLATLTEILPCAREEGLEIRGQDSTLKSLCVWDADVLGYENHLQAIKHTGAHSEWMKGCCFVVAFLWCLTAWVLPCQLKQLQWKVPDYMYRCEKIREKNALGKGRVTVEYGCQQDFPGGTWDSGEMPASGNSAVFHYVMPLSETVEDPTRVLQS